MGGAGDAPLQARQPQQLLPPSAAPSVHTCLADSSVRHIRTCPRHRTFRCRCMFPPLCSRSCSSILGNNQRRTRTRPHRGTFRVRGMSPSVRSKNCSSSSGSSLGRSRTRPGRCNLRGHGRCPSCKRGSRCPRRPPGSRKRPSSARTPSGSLCGRRWPCSCTLPSLGGPRSLSTQIHLGLHVLRPRERKHHQSARKPPHPGLPFCPPRTHARTLPPPTTSTPTALPPATLTAPAAPAPTQTWPVSLRARAPSLRCLRHRRDGARLPTCCRPLEALTNSRGKMPVGSSYLLDLPKLGSGEPLDPLLSASLNFFTFWRLRRAHGWGVTD
jgi:hypothetical protein